MQQQLLSPASENTCTTRIVMSRGPGLIFQSQKPTKRPTVSPKIQPDRPRATFRTWGRLLPSLKPQSRRTRNPTLQTTPNRKAKAPHPTCLKVLFLTVPGSIVICKIPKPYFKFSGLVLRPTCVERSRPSWRRRNRSRSERPR